MAMSKSTTVAIIPGFGEGHYQTKHLKKALEVAGYRVIKAVKHADIIIAHSGGCYLAPGYGTAQFVLHVGYPYWPGRSILRAAAIKVVQDYNRMSFFGWFAKCTINVLYILKHRHTLRTITGYLNREQILLSLPKRQTFVINDLDPYCHEDDLRKTAGSSHVYISLPGTHDHLWENPEEYVNLLKSVV